MLFVWRTTIVAHLKTVRIESVKIHVKMAIHVTRLLSVALKIIVLYARVHQDLWAIHLWAASKNVLNQDHNVLPTAIAHHRRHASIKLVEIHALNEIHVVKMLNAVQFNIIQRATVHQDGLAIHNGNATNVSVSHSYELKFLLFSFKKIL